MKIGRLITFGVVLLVAGILFVGGANTETRRQQFKFVSKNDISVTLIAPDLKLEVKNEKTGQSMILDGISAQVLSNGDILYNANDYSLRKISWDGKEEVLIPSREVNAPIYLNEDETLVAFTKAEDFRGGEFPFTNGVAVYNLKTGDVRVLLTKKGETIGNYGWVGDRLLIDFPDDDGFEPLLLDLDGNLAAFYNGLLLPLVRKWPKRSFDGRFLAYESYENSVVVLDLETGSFETIENAVSPQWTERGLQIVESNVTKVVDPESLFRR